jgi:hypothetical protein
MRLALALTAAASLALAGYAATPKPAASILIGFDCGAAGVVMTAREEDEFTAACARIERHALQVSQ